MKLIFVHGFGGSEGGSMESALDQATQTAGVSLFPIRWSSGSLAPDVGKTALRTLAEAVSDPNRLRGAVRAATTLYQGSSESWERAVAATVSARVTVRNAIRHFGGTAGDFCLMGFSLGCRPLLHALADCAVLPENLRCIAFVGAAAPRHLYERLPRRFLTEGRGRIIHVWSKNDGVLSLLYPLVQGAYPAAGAAPVNVPGIRDVEFDVGHTGYGAVASELVRVVTESHLAGRSKAPA